MDGPLMRKINGKMFLALLVAGVALLGGVAAVHSFQYKRIGRNLLWHARRAEEQGEQTRSATYLQRYLEFNPRDTAEKANLARLWAGDAYPPGSKARTRAMKSLDDLLRQEDNAELRRLLVKVAVEQFEFKLARDHLQRILPFTEVEKWTAEDGKALAERKPLPKLMEDKDRGELEGYWGQVLESEKKFAEAIACYRLALRHAPRLQKSYVQMANLLRRQTQTDPIRRSELNKEADAYIDQLVDANSASYEPYLARWRYRREFGLLRVTEAGKQGAIDLDTAADDVAQAMKRRPESVEVLLAAADVERLRARVVMDDPKRSPEERRTGLKEHRTRALEHLKRGEELAGLDKTPAAEAALFQLLWHKGNLLLDDLDLQRFQQEEDRQAAADDRKLKDEVNQVIARVRRTYLPAAAEYMQARLLVYERRWGDAATLFERARRQFEGMRDLACQADLYLGQCYERLEQPTQMFKAFQRVLDFDPSSLPALRGMALARWSQGQLDNAMAQYQVAVRQKRVPVAVWLDIARLELQRQGQSPTPDWGRVEKVVQSAREAITDPSFELDIVHAEALVRQGKNKEAGELLEKAQKKNPAEIEYWGALVDLALRQKDVTRAQDLLRQARLTLNDRVSLRLAEARMLHAAEGEKAIKKIAKLADGRQSFTEDDQARLLTGLADTVFRAGGANEARKLWQAMTGLARHRTDLRLQLLLFDLALKQGDEAGMQKTLADVRDIEQSSGAYYGYGQALYQIWQAKKVDSPQERRKMLAKARQQLDGVLTQRPAWSAVFLARAEIAELTDNPEQAIKDLTEAVNNGENSPSVLRRLVALLMRRGRDGEAKVQLSKLHQSLLYNSDLGKFKVAIAVRGNEMERAVEEMRQVVREDTKDPQDLIWMAGVLIAAGRAAEAEKRLQAALDAGGSDPAPWLSMVEFLVGQKRRADALALIGKATAKLPADRASLTLARCHELVGDGKQAQQFYEEALRRRPDDAATVRTVATAYLASNRGPEAEALLRRMLGGELKSLSPADADWARRSLAMLLAAGTDYRRFAEALELVGLKLDSAGRLPREEPRDESPEERRARARVLASQNQRQFRERAIALLKDLDRGKALTPDDEFILAMLYEAEGESRKCLAILESLSQPRTRSPRFLAQYVLSLILHNQGPADHATAEKVIGWLEEMERQREVGPNTFASVEMRARLLEAQGKGEDAVDLLRRHVSRQEARPEEVLLVLASLSRQKRFKDAFELCEKAWTDGKCQPEIVGGMSVSLLRVMEPSDSQVARVEKHLLRASKAKPESTVLLMHLSALYDRRGQYDKAAEMYRAVLKREPNNVVALNNLAWLLAHRSGEADKALEYINKAVSGIGRRADLLDTRAVVHLALKDTAKALADMKEATSESATPTRLFHLAKVHHEERDSTKAREVLRQAREKGLQVSSLHPVEQETARRLFEEYGIR